MSVFVIDKRKQPLMPCSERRARRLLGAGRAVVVRLRPFTIRLRDRTGGQLQPVRLSIDPGSKTTGVTVARECGDRRHALWLGEICHRGDSVREKLHGRRCYRRRRRSANLRHRKPRLSNRTRPKGWLAPSLRSRVDNIGTWTRRLRAVCPVTAITVESVCFDTQLLRNPEISGVEYQQGTLAGYEVREYVLTHWGRKCVYCARHDVPLTVDHVVSRRRGGSNRPSNLLPACVACNQEKGSRPVEVYLEGRPELLDKVLRHLEAPLRDAAAVTTTRRAVVERLHRTGLPVEEATGGRTKWNRKRFGVPKTHALDALCAGEVGGVFAWERPVLAIAGMGRGSYQRTRVTKAGFPRGYLLRAKRVRGFATGDLVRAEVPRGKKSGTWTGRVAVRASGSFNIQTPGAAKVVQGISHRYCRLLQRADGYRYTTTNTEAALPPRPEVRGLRAGD